MIIMPRRSAAFRIAVNTVAPAITGIPVVGEVLTSSTGTWTGTGISYTYQWKADGVNISGATSSTYTLTLSEDDKDITCTVTATNGGGAVSQGSNTLVMIPNLAASWDFSDSSSVTTVSNKISQVNDKSGNANHAIQVVDANRPVYNLRTINGKNAADFDGGTQRLVFTEIAPTTGYTVFIVGAVDADINTKSMLGNTAGGFVFRASSGEQLQIVRESQAILLTGSTTLGDGTAYIFSAATSAAGNSIRLNGVSEGSNATDPAYTAGPTRLGADNTGNSNRFNGAIGKVFIFTRIITDSEKNVIGNGLVAAGWGMTWTNI